MEMCYDGALVMPNNYAVVNEDEMTYVDGGVEVYLNNSHLNKYYCLAIAAGYTFSTGLGVLRIAMEIYAHAVLYVGGMTAAVISAIKNYHIADDQIHYILHHSNPVNIGEDCALRVAAYTAIWAAVPSR